MRIERTECFIKTMKLREPYSISYESVDQCENVFIKISTEDGNTGWGCAAPVENVTGEISDDIIQFYTDTIEPLLNGADVFRYAFILESLKQECLKRPSVLAMVDMALHDLIAQKAGVPLYKLLGGYRRSIPTSITIGIMPLNSALSYAKNYVKLGFTILKIKGGLNVLEDIEKINKIREVFGSRITIRFDANQGYTIEDSLKFLNETAGANLELFEQPTPMDDFELLGKVTRKTSIPVMADESLLSLKDVFQLSADQCTDLINIKLMKTGGILDGMHINSVAKAAGIHSMIGCMDESALGIAAGLHFALSRPNIHYADLDGHLDIVNDPFEGMLKIESGILYPSDVPGLGWIGMKINKI